MTRVTLLIAALAMFLVSCEKVIDVDIDPSMQHYVIEGNITNEAGPYHVLISRSTDYFDPQEYPLINDALVVISDNEGTVDTLDLVEGGKYETSVITGIPGNTYSLYIKIGDEEFTAESQMPALTELDSLAFEQMDFGPPSEDGKPPMMLIGYLTDPVEFDNFYKADIYIEDEYKDDLILFDDIVNNGLEMQFGSFSREYKPGEVYQVELWNIDKAVYNYWSILSDISGGGMFGSTTPANPESNIDGASLGYFSAASVHSLTIVSE